MSYSLTVSFEFNNESYSRHELLISDSDYNNKTIILELINYEIKPEYEANIKENIYFESEFYIEFSLPYSSKAEFVKVINNDTNEENNELITADEK